MTVKEKQEYFYEMAIESATAQNIAMVNEYKEQLEKEGHEFKKQLKNKYEKKIKNAKEEMLKSKNAQLSQKSIQLRYEYNHWKEEQKEVLFQKVKEEVLAYCKTSSYQEKLKEQIERAIVKAKHQECMLYVMPVDFERISACGFPNYVHIEKTSQDFWGGFMMEILNTKVVINNTYASEFLECKAHFQFAKETDVEVRS